MAWLDNSPVCSKGFEQEQTLAANGRDNTQLGMDRLMKVFPFLVVVIAYFQSLLLSKKLNSIEQKIHVSALNSTQLVVAILKELTTTAKRYQSLLAAEKNLSERIRGLKSTLIVKSHEVLKREDQFGIPPSSSHKTVLSLINREPKNIPRVNQPIMPISLHWRSTHTNSSSTTKICKPSSLHHKLFLHASLIKLVELLVAPVDKNYWQDESEVKVSRSDDLFFIDTPLVCGVSFKLTPSFSKQAVHKGPSFWQQTHEGGDLLASYSGKQLWECIDSLFFTHEHHFEEFKEILARNNQFEVQELIINFEINDKIKIQQPTVASTLQ